MAIIIHAKDQNMDWARWNIYPDQFVPESEKKGNDWVKSNMDYFANVGYSQFIKGRETFVNNYNLVKGILRPEDFYIIDDEDSTLRSFTETLIKDVELPSDIKHYTILNPPLNTLIGELSKRPDTARVKAFDDDSKNEELQIKTEMLQQYIMETAMQQMKMQMSMQGQQVDEDKLKEATMDKIQEYMTDYTSTAEKWSNHVLEALKVELNMKEVSEDCFRDLLITSREFYHIYENSSKLGLGVENLNPKNTWFLTLPDKKYVKSAFAAGTVHVMELGEIIDRFDLDKKEIDHLRNGVKELSLFSPRESNFENPTTSGWESIKYDTYSPLIQQQRLLIESELKENVDPLNDFLGLSSNVNTFGNKYVVIQAYWESKKKVGKLTYIDEKGQPQTTLVDESYSKIPNQISIEWNYINQWYRGLKVGSDVYKVEPYELLDYCPIIGVVHEVKNVNDPRSLVDLLKPYQMLFNVCLNQLWKLLEKEIGNVYQGSLRHIPTPKDGDGQDALDIWEEEARRRGALWLDDSPENLKAPSNFQMWKNIDLTREKEVNWRREVAEWCKNMSWELVGISKERAGSVAATQTATGTNTALSQSYAQTEPYFAQHEYVLNDVYQAMLDAAQYIESKKPFSTISYINTEGEQAFIKVNTDDIKMRDLKVFVTSRIEDQKAFESLRELAQPMLQNGATSYEISVLYTTNSIRQMKQIFKNLKDKMEKQTQAENELKEKEIQQQQEQAQAQMKQAEQDKEADRQLESQEKELDRINKKEIAIINAQAKERSAMGAGPDAGNEYDTEMIKLDRDAQGKERDFQLKLQQMAQKDKENQDYLRLELEKIRVEREKLQASITIARQNRIASSKSKSK